MHFIKTCLFALAVAGAAQAEPVTCHFTGSEAKRNLAITIQGEPGQKPSWVVQVLALQSGRTNDGMGMWIGAADKREELRLAEVSISVFRWNNQPGLGISVASAPVIDAVSFGMLQAVVGSAQAIEPVLLWGILKVDGLPVLSQLMHPRPYGGGTFLEMSSVFLNRPDENAPFGVDPEAAAAFKALLAATATVTLEIHQVFDSPPKALAEGQQPLVSFGYPAAAFSEGQTRATKSFGSALAEYGKGCPNHKVSP